MPREVWDMRSSVRAGKDPAAAGVRQVVRIPDESHPITIEPNPHRLVIRLDGVVVADTTHALTLREAHYPAVQYVPLGDVEPAYVRRSDHATYCPFKGDASYYDLVVDGREIKDAIWTYEEPYDYVGQIKGHVAFYAHNVSFASA